MPEQQQQQERPELNQDRNNPHQDRDRHLPHLEDSLVLEQLGGFWIYDTQFYPYTTAATPVNPVFAITSNKDILVYQIRPGLEQQIRLIQRIEDEDVDACNSSLAWSKDLVTGAPLLCVAGNSSNIKIRDAQTGALRVTLTGHGGPVGQLAVSPTNPEILASASDDHTIRIWSLSSSHKRQPCVALLAGEGHLKPVSSLAFHETGRYILSGGLDNVVNLWTIPEHLFDCDEIFKPIVVHFPHFSTSEVHSHLVECVAFHGDLILSKGSKESSIILWQITGFNSATSLPDPARYNNKGRTRSAFLESPGLKLYMNLLEFDVPGCYDDFMQFSICSPLSGGVTRPILAICNGRSEVLFWDLSRVYDYDTPIKSVQTSKTSDSPPQTLFVQERAPRRANKRTKIEENTSEENETNITGAPTSTSGSGASGPSANAVTRRRYLTDGPIMALEAHKVVTLTDVSEEGSIFDARQVMWSACGTWCVVSDPEAIYALRR